MIPELTRRPLPSFDEWLSVNGDGSRGDGFEAFSALAKRTHAAEWTDHLTADEAAFLRMLMGFQVAVIELCNIENQKGRTPAEIALTLPRVLAATSVYAMASVLIEDAPMRKIAKILIEEFRFAAKEAADQIEASR